MCGPPPIQWAAGMPDRDAGRNSLGLAPAWRVHCRKRFQRREDVNMRIQASRLVGCAALVAVLAAAIVSCFSMPAKAQEPIKIGFGMALTGPLAANGKQALLGMKIWEEETN